MSDLRKAAQAVIQAWDDPTGTTGVCRALDALRAALAELTDWEAVAADQALTLALLRSEPKQEPVAWMVYTLDGKSVCVTDNPADFTDQHRALPLYTRHGVSDEQ